MSANEMSRRHVLTVIGGIGLGAVALKAEAAQDLVQATRLPFPPDQAGRIHREGLNDVSKFLGKTPLDSVDGLFRIVDLLLELNVITKDESERLKEIIRSIFSKENPAAIRDRVETIFNQLKQKASDVAVAIASIARDSIAFVLDNKRVFSIVASDVSGALTGAAIGAKFGGRVFAVIGAIAGAVSESADAAFRRTPPTK